MAYINWQEIEQFPDVAERYNLSKRGVALFLSIYDVLTWRSTFRDVDDAIFDEIQRLTHETVQALTEAYSMRIKGYFPNTVNLPNLGATWYSLAMERHSGDDAFSGNYFTLQDGIYIANIQTLIQAQSVNYEYGHGIWVNGVAASRIFKPNSADIQRQTVSSSHIFVVSGASVNNPAIVEPRYLVRNTSLTQLEIHNYHKDTYCEVVGL